MNLENFQLGCTFYGGYCSHHVSPLSSRSKELIFKVTSKDEGNFHVIAKYLGGVIKVCFQISLYLISNECSYDCKGS